MRIFCLVLVVIAACYQVDDGTNFNASEIEGKPSLCAPGTPVASGVVNALQGVFQIQHGFASIQNPDPGYWRLGLAQPQPVLGVVIHATVNDDGYHTVSASLSPETSPSSTIEVMTLVVNSGTPANSYSANQHFSISVYPVCP